MKAAFALLSDSKKYARFLKPGESENKAKAVEK